MRKYMLDKVAAKKHASTAKMELVPGFYSIYSLPGKRLWGTVPPVLRCWWCDIRRSEKDRLYPYPNSGVWRGLLWFSFFQEIADISWHNWQLRGGTKITAKTKMIIFPIQLKKIIVGIYWIWYTSFTVTPQTDREGRCAIWKLYALLFSLLLQALLPITYVSI